MILILISIQNFLTGDSESDVPDRRYWKAIRIGIAKKGKVIA